MIWGISIHIIKFNSLIVLTLGQILSYIIKIFHFHLFLCIRAVDRVIRALADGGMTILPDTHIITYSDADGGSSLDCWVVPNTVTASVQIGASGVAQHVPLEIEASLPFPEGTAFVI